MMDDRELIECFDIIYELYPETRRPAPIDAAGRVPSLAESRDALRLFVQLDHPELRTAIRILLRTLAARVTPSAPSDPHPSAANTPM